MSNLRVPIYSFERYAQLMACCFRDLVHPAIPGIGACLRPCYVNGFRRATRLPKLRSSVAGHGSHDVSDQRGGFTKVPCDEGNCRGYLQPTTYNLRPRTAYADIFISIFPMGLYPTTSKSSYWNPSISLISSFPRFHLNVGNSLGSRSNCT